MAKFVFIHGAGDVGWYWHLVEAELRRKGHGTVAPDLPCDDDTAGLSEYADTVSASIGKTNGLVVVAQSAGAFTAPLVCDRTPVQQLVLVAGLIPAPGEAARDWWTNTGHPGLEEPFDEVETFYHDVPAELVQPVACWSAQANSRKIAPLWCGAAPEPPPSPDAQR